MFEEVDAYLVTRLTGLLREAVRFYEPRVTLDQVSVSVSDEVDGLLLISLTYTVRSTNSRFNMVYPFYLNEAVPPTPAGEESAIPRPRR